MTTSRFGEDRSWGNLRERMRATRKEQEQNFLVISFRKQLVRLLRIIAGVGGPCSSKSVRRTVTGDCLQL